MHSRQDDEFEASTHTDSCSGKGTVPRRRSAIGEVRSSNRWQRSDAFWMNTALGGQLVITSSHGTNRVWGSPGTHHRRRPRPGAPQALILAKLRRNEAFALNVEYDGDSGGGRMTVWLAPSIQLQFRFDGGRSPSINRSWLDALMASANSPEGLRVLAEPTDVPPVPSTTASIPVHRDGLR